jgi:hypothetical protein
MIQWNWISFLLLSAIRSTQTKRKYQGRLNTFFDFIALSKISLDKRCKIFIKDNHENPKYPLYCAFKFIIH